MAIRIMQIPMKTSLLPKSIGILAFLKTKPEQTETARIYKNDGHKNHADSYDDKSIGILAFHKNAQNKNLLCNTIGLQQHQTRKEPATTFGVLR